MKKLLILCLISSTCFAQENLPKDLNNNGIPDDVPNEIRTLANLQQLCNSEPVQTHLTRSLDLARAEIVRLNNQLDTKLLEQKSDYELRLKNREEELKAEIERLKKDNKDLVIETKTLQTQQTNNKESLLVCEEKLNSRIADKALNALSAGLGAATCLLYQKYDN